MFEQNQFRYSILCSANEKAIYELRFSYEAYFNLNDEKQVELNAQEPKISPQLK